jgi:hypothetical protein
METSHLPSPSKMALTITHCIIVIITTVSFYLYYCNQSLSSQIQSIRRFRPPPCLSPPRMPQIPPPEGDQFQSEWLPIYDTRTPYNEDEIVGLLREFEHLYMKVSSVRPDEVGWAPEGGHEIDETLCRELGMDSTVISLLRRLTYNNFPDGGIHMDTWMCYMNYRNEYDIRSGRYGIGIPPYPFPDDKVKLLPHDVILADGDREVNVIILDTKESESALLFFW